MAARYPGAGLYFFIGEDNLASLHTWKDIAALRTLVTFVILSRGLGTPDPGGAVISRPIEISSTGIRNRIAIGQSVRYLLPDSACEMISQHRLYRND